MRVNLLIVWVEMSLMDWVLIWIVFEWIQISCTSYGVGWDGFYVNMDWSGLERAEINFYAKQYDYI